MLKSGEVQVTVRKGSNVKSQKCSELDNAMVDVKLVMNVFCLGTAQIRPSGIINTASDATEETVPRNS